MNFLLHRHFAQRETGSDALAFGAMLPDLVRLVDRRWRPRPTEEATTAPLGPTGRALLDGVAHHLEADSWFHRTRVFHDGEKRTAAALRATAGDARRPGLFGHVTWEMCLDGAWLRRTGDIPTALAALSVDVALFSVESNQALRTATSTPTVSPQVLADRLAQLWARLPDLASGYATGAGVAQRLDGIRRSLGLPRTSADVLERWSSSLEGCIEDAALSLDALEAERQDALDGAAAASPSARG